jgi:hypothetical protein
MVVVFGLTALALTLREAGRSPEALAHFIEAVQTTPDLKIPSRA